MSEGFGGVSWYVWAAVAGLIGALFTLLQIPKQTPHTVGLTHFALRWFHSIAWFLLSLSFLLRGLAVQPASLADTVGLTGLGTYIAFWIAYTRSNRPFKSRQESQP